MQALTQREPLLISSIIRHVARHHPSGEVVSVRGVEVPHRTTYAALDQRARQLLRVLRRLGVLPGDRVATLALAGYRHLEVAFAATGLGAAFHPLDPQLADDHLATLMDQGDDCVLFVERDFLDLAASLIPRVRHCVRRVVVMCHEAELPMVSLPVSVSLHCYEPMLAADGPEEEWPSFDENVPAVVCATAGATGSRRLVQRSQRDVVLQALAANQPDGLGLRAVDRVAMCAEMHHPVAWSLPFIAPMTGAALLLPGWPSDGAGLARLIAEERATCAVGHPLTFEGLLRHLPPISDPGAAPDAADPRRIARALPTLRRVMMGAVAARAPLLAAFAGSEVNVRQGWGLAEAGAGLTTTEPSEATAPLPPAAAARHRASQGRALFGVELKLTDSDGEELPWDGLAVGELRLRGPAVAERYLGDAAPAVDDAGWLPTGDIASIDPFGYVSVVDRLSDMIRSGGDWISGARVEAAALGHSDVAEAACVAARHPKWTERPLLLLVPWPGRTVDEAAVLAQMWLQLPRWSLPDAVVVLPALPRTAAGRIDKMTLRRQYADHLVGSLSTRA